MNLETSHQFHAANKIPTFSVKLALYKPTVDDLNAKITVVTLEMSHSTVTLGIEHE